MAAKRGKYYRLCQLDRARIVSQAEFETAIKDGYAIQSRRLRKIAHIKPKYRMVVDHQCNVVRFELAVKPEPDPAGVASWWPKLVGRHEFYYGKRDSVLFLWHDQAFR